VETLGKGLNNHIQYVEYLLQRKLTESEKSIFEWAYMQGYEDSSEGIPRENIKSIS
jgi:hypothetical protein